MIVCHSKADREAENDIQRGSEREILFIVQRRKERENERESKRREKKET